MRALDTRYKGYRFRSRLEARWAVFFDALGIPYQYEPQGFDLDGVAYLPDFWLPRQASWAEVKGHAPPTPDEQDKAKRLALASGHPVLMLFDIPSQEQQRTDANGHSYTYWEWRSTLWRWAYVDPRDSGPRVCEVDDGGLLWCRCPICGVVDVGLWGNITDLPCRCIPHDSALAAKYQRPRDNGEAPEILMAYDAARAARFEHGAHGMREKGAPHD